MQFLSVGGLCFNVMLLWPHVVLHLAFMFRAKIWRIHALMALVFYARDHFFPQIVLRCSCCL